MDWRSSIGNVALLVIQEFFESNQFTTQDTIEYVKYVYDPSAGVFSFIYQNPEAPSVSISSVLIATTYIVNFTPLGK